jgi:flagellin
MSVSLVNNLASLGSQARVNATSSQLNATIQRLSSGLRINMSGDDAAGLAIANRHRSDVQQLRQGIRNANDGLSQMQIIDGGLNTISNLLDRAMTLATQSASETFTGSRTVLNNELTQVKNEIDRQAAQIGLNTAGTNATQLDVYVGGTSTTASNNQVSIDLTNKAVDAAGLGVNGLDISSAANAQTAIGTIQNAISTLGTVQGTVGAGENRLMQAIDLATSQMTNIQAAESRIRDADIAAEASDLSRLSVLQQSGVAALAQANQSSQAVLSLLR